MKKLASIFALAAALAVACQPVNPEPQPEPEPQPQPDPQPQPQPDPEPFKPEANTIWVLDAEGEQETEIKLTAAVSFVSEAGMYSMYSADVPVLTKKMILDGYAFPATANIAAISTIYSLLGREVDITKESMHWIMSLQVPGLYSFDLFEGDVDKDITGGHFRFDVDKEKLEGSLEVVLNLKDGKTLGCCVTGPYTPGGENETLFIWNDMSRPVRAAFYDSKNAAAGNPPIMYFTNGQIDYGEEIPNTTYARITPSAAICDGQPHDIATCLANGSLQFYFRDFDSEWDMVSGNISIEHVKDYEYIVIVDNAEAEDREKKLADRSFKMVFNGTLKDVHEERPVDNKFETGGKTYTIKSCVVDLSGSVAAIYMLQQAGITTVEAALAADPLVINFSTSKFGTSIGLSTDKENFAVIYGGQRWDRTNLDTGSFICHEYNPATGLLHCQLANICLQVTYKTMIKMEYKGTPVYIK